MKIRVKYEVSESETNDTYDLQDDLGLSVEEWNEMSEDDKRELLEGMAENNAPYWMVDTYEEE